MKEKRGYDDGQTQPTIELNIADWTLRSYSDVDCIFCFPLAS